MDDHKGKVHMDDWIQFDTFDEAFAYCYERRINLIQKFNGAFLVPAN
ncbi:MAG: hypothetical protein WC052_05200 [Patescibacteria group bacterium]